MAIFGIGTNENKSDSGELKGQIYPVACKTWFTSTGAVRPLSFKFEGDDGQIQTVENLTVKYVDSKNYSGIPSKVYGCEAIIGGLRNSFQLVFFLEECKWVMTL
ncbi:MAG: hypothetical protein KH230_20420 [Enterocloster asparagiformis]|nr:hypothetical protein [Enterocloster asparagiformis]